jgi:hypothetical protein
MTCSRERLVRLPKDAKAERRANIRFPLTLEIRYAVWERGGPVDRGSGRSIELSSTGLSFTADRPLRTGQTLEVYIEWPVLLGGGVKLQLIMAGVVVRTNGRATALESMRYEFRTRRLAPLAAAPQEAIG